MGDITMCLTADCPKADTCKRKLATPNDLWQSYAPFPGGDDCEYYWPYPARKENQ